MTNCGYGNQIQYRQLQLPTNTLFAHTCTHRMNCSITVQCIQANYLLNPRWPLHVPSAHAFILLCQCKVEISQIQDSNWPKYTAQCYNESPFTLWYSTQVFSKSEAVDTHTARDDHWTAKSHTTLKQTVPSVTHDSHLGNVHTHILDHRRVI